jgi:putative heme transporter
MAVRPRRRLHLPKVPRELRWAITIVVLIFVVELVVLPDIANVRKSVRLLGRVNVAYLALAFVLEVAALLSYAELSRAVLDPNAPGRWRMFRINMASLSVSHVLPGGTAPGTAIGYRLLLESGVSGPSAGFALATQGIGSAVVLNGIFWVALIISIPFNGFNPLYLIAAALGAVLLGAFAGTIFLLTKGKYRSIGWLRRLANHIPFVTPEQVSRLLQELADRFEVLLRDRQLLRRALGWAAANWLLDAASLGVFLLALGARLNPIDLLVAYGLANILAVIPITPGGLGVIEGILIPTIVGFHVPKTVAILGVIGYRLVNFWLPIPVGGAAYLSLRIGAHPRRNGGAGNGVTPPGGAPSPSAGGTSPAEANNGAAPTAPPTDDSSDQLSEGTPVADDPPSGSDSPRHGVGSPST